MSIEDKGSSIGSGALPASNGLDARAFLARARDGYFFNSIPTVRAIRLTEPA